MSPISHTCGSREKQWGSTPGEGLGWGVTPQRIYLTSLWTRCWQWSIGQCSPLLLSPSSIWVMTLIKSYDFYLSHVSLVWTISSLHNMCPFCQIASNCHRSEAPPQKIWSPQLPWFPRSRSPTPGPTHIGRKIWWPFRLLGSYLVALPSISTAMRWRGAEHEFGLSHCSWNLWVFAKIMTPK